MGCKARSINARLAQNPVHWPVGPGDLGIMEKKMEATIMGLYRDLREKKMEATIVFRV